MSEPIIEGTKHFQNYLSKYENNYKLTVNKITLNFIKENLLKLLINILKVDNLIIGKLEEKTLNFIYDEVFHEKDYEQLIEKIYKNLNKTRKPIPFYFRIDENNILIGFFYKNSNMINLYLMVNDYYKYEIILKNFLNNSKNKINLVLFSNLINIPIISYGHQILFYYLFNITNIKDINEIYLNNFQNIILKLIEKVNKFDLLSFMNYIYFKDYFTTDFELNDTLLLLRDKLFVKNEIIDSEVNKYLRYEKELPKNIKVPIKYDYSVELGDEYLVFEKEIPYDKYIHFYTGAIFSSQRSTSDFINFFYKKISAGNNYMIMFEEDRKNISIVKDGISTKLELNNDSIEFIYNTITEFLRIDKFFLIEVIIKGNPPHYNIALCEKDNSSDNIYMSYYEPHGNFSILESNYLINFFQQLKEISKGKFIIKFNKEKFSMQTLSKDREGFCLIFGFFWINVIIKIIKYNIQRKSYISSNKWVENIETYYINKITKDKLYNFIVAFAVKLYND